MVKKAFYRWRKRKGQKIVDEFQIQVTDHPAETDWQWLEDTINRFNIQLTGYDDYRPLDIFIRDSAVAIIAGLSAFSSGGTFLGYYTPSVHVSRRNLYIKAKSGAGRQTRARGSVPGEPRRRRSGDVLDRQATRAWQDV